MARTIKDLFYEARGFRPGRSPDISRRQLVEIASQLPGAPDDFTESQLDKLESAKTPPWGEPLRYFAAAAKLSFFDVLAASPIHYWRPLGSDKEILLDLCRILGCAVTEVSGRLVIEMPKGNP